MRDDKENIIVNKTLDFSVNLIKFCEKLEEKRKFVVAKQLLRAGTSIGANVYEAQNAESKADFIHKMKIAAKEASEFLYWITICERAESYISDEQVKRDLLEIIRIISKIIVSSKTSTVTR